MCSEPATNYPRHFSTILEDAYSGIEEDCLLQQTLISVGDTQARVDYEFLIKILKKQG